MTPQVQIWMPAILALFGSLLVVVFTAWLNTKALRSQIEGVDKKLTAQIEALRAEMRQGFAELRLDFHTEISQLTRRVERLEEQRGLVRP
jgi:cell division protein FtsB